jgi:response regulator RpfG family c-di-GMP phosphodiesterase
MKTIIVQDTDQAVLEICQNLEPHLILLDELLPANPGHVRCASIKAQPVSQSIPVILISAVVNIEKVAADCKADNYIKSLLTCKT